jgi:hypothetical protein
MNSPVRPLKRIFRDSFAIICRISAELNEPIDSVELNEPIERKRR